MWWSAQISMLHGNVVDLIHEVYTVLIEQVSRGQQGEKSLDGRKRWRGGREGEMKWVRGREKGVKREE